MLPQALTMIRGAVEKLEQDSALQSDRDTLADDLARTYDGLRSRPPATRRPCTSPSARRTRLSHIGLQDGAS
jgi:hypothetical protein